MSDEGQEPEQQDDAGELLDWYIEKYETAYGRSTVPFSDQLRRAMTPATRLRAKQAATTAVAPWVRRKARELAQGPDPLRLHLGCGWNRIDGWVNIDLVGAATDLVWDLRRPLPFADGSAQVVFLEHVLEHLPYSEAITVLGHARRVLAPGAVLRVGVPDAGMYARLYAEDPEALRTVRLGRPTPMLALREVFQEHAHVAAYDGQTLGLVMERAGFPGATRCEPGTSTLLDDSTAVPDLPERWHETVYLEARRPPD